MSDSRFPWGDRLLPVLVLTYALTIGGLWWLHISGSVPELKVTGFDAVTTPGKPTTLAAKLEIDQYGPFNPDLEGIQVDFTSGLMPEPMEAETDDEGVAQFSFTPRSVDVPRAFHARPHQRSDYRLREIDMYGAAGSLWVWKPDDPIVICDIDDTITHGEGWKTLVRGPGPDPHPGAAVVLSNLTAGSSSKRLVFVTARDDGILNSTRWWLHRHKFPKGPVLGRDWSLSNMADPGPDKLKIFRGLQALFSNIRLGVGNSEGDCFAYRSAGIPHITLDRSHCDGIDGAPSCRVAKDWNQVEQFLDGN